jgi:hypothetical protein
MTVTAKSRHQSMQVHDSDLLGLYDAGWSYVEPAEVPGFSIIAWESDKAPVVPLWFITPASAQVVATATLDKGRAEG